MTYKKIKARIMDRNVLIEHDGGSHILLHDQPLEMPHTSSKGTNRLQSTSMMDFQGKISMVLRAIASQKGVILPLLKGEYGVEINISTPRPRKELPILESVKAIIDAINNEIVSNDAEIYSLRVNLYSSKPGSRMRESMPYDSIDLRIYDVLTQTTKLQFNGLTTYIVPKSNPILSGGFDDENFYPHIELLHQPMRELLYKDGFEIAASNHYAVKLHFNGAIQSKDLDNMAKTYLPILYGTQIVTPFNIVKLELSKEHVSNSIGYIDIRVNCNSMQP
ncbi:hypothetical protein [Paucisalibacillus globulus]|uniref:hypothetical protein n=1 Tax=Paucisalibacillus globulus TaxID=351095 RepID=UPI0004219401|nr:hypothetical protein [Paucisalibacillus globulus]